MRVLGAIILTGLAIIVFVGVEYVARFAVLFLFGVLLAVAAIWAGVIVHSVGDGKPRQGIVGVSGQNMRKNLVSEYKERRMPVVLQGLLGVVLSGRHGPFVGSNLSGDLKDPQASIPPGTIAAVVVTTVVFSIQVVIAAGGAVRRDALIEFPGKTPACRASW